MAEHTILAYVRYLDVLRSLSESGHLGSSTDAHRCSTFSEWLGVGGNAGDSVLELLQLRQGNWASLPNAVCSAQLCGGESGSSVVAGGGCDGDSGTSVGGKSACVGGGRTENIGACNVGSFDTGVGAAVNEVQRGLHVDAIVKPVGRNHQKNKRKRENRKTKRVPVDTGFKSHARDVGFFSTCSEDVQQQLKDTRAQMLVSQNKLKQEQCEAAIKEVQMLNKTRVNEVNFELKRLTLEDKLATISEKRGVTGGSARTVISSTISSSPPTLLSGSVSPSSSISMAEERKLRQSVVDQATELKELKEELLRLRSGVPKKRGNVSEWTFKSPYDNFTVDGVHKSKLPGYVRNSGSSSYVDGGQDFHLSSHDY